MDVATRASCIVVARDAKEKIEQDEKNLLV